MINEIVKFLDKEGFEYGIKKRPSGKKKREHTQIWVNLDRSKLKDFVKSLFKFGFPHLSVISGADRGDHVELIYHFALNYDKKFGEIVLNVRVSLPKADLEIDSITDVIPGSIVTEREKMEFLGVKFKGITDESHAFLVGEEKPWIKDDERTKKLVRDTYKEGKK